MMDNYIYILSKQSALLIERLHICTWSIEKDTYFTEYGLEIQRNQLKQIDIEMQLPLPNVLDGDNFKCLYNNIINVENCRFIFNADVKELSPINGKAPFGTRIDFKNDRKITALPLELNENIKINPKTNTLNITLDTSDDQITDTIYIRFLIKTKEPAFSFEKKEITRRIITHEVRVNECRTASESVIKLQKKNYETILVNQCFCFHIIPHNYNIDFIDDKKLKTIRSLEASGFNNYLGDLKDTFKLSLKEHDYNIIFCKQENSDKDKSKNYSFFSRYSKEYIGNVQIGIAIAVNILCSLLFAAGNLHEVDMEQSFWCRMAIEYYFAFGILILLIIYLLHCRFWKKI